MKRSFQLTSVIAGTVVACGVLSAVRAGERVAQSAQAAGAAATFEVAVIKLDNSGSGRHSQSFTGSRYRAVNVSIKSVLERAYGMTDYQILGEPTWVDSDTYDIDAKIDDDMMAAIGKMPPEQQDEQSRAMFRSLLADRFQLKVSQETRELPAYVVVVAKNGPKFKPTALPAAPTDGSAPTDQQKQRGTNVNGNSTETALEGLGIPISQLLHAIAYEPEFGGRVLVDETGLKGEYDLKMQWTRENLTAESARPGAGPAEVASEPSLFTALNQQLGLKVESKKAQVPVTVIQHIERPSEN